MGLTDLAPAPQRYQTIQVRMDAEVCYITLARPEAGNTISRTLIDDIAHALDAHEALAKIVVLEGAPEVFCLGADFQGMHRDSQAGVALRDHAPEPMYDVWRRLACGPFISVAHVRGKVNAGGVGFVAACDVVLSEDKAVFSLSEMMFGLTPACVMPFLVRRIGMAKANYLTLSTQPVMARQAEQWGLVDACEENSDVLLRKHLVRMKRLNKAAIIRHKTYSAELDDSLSRVKPIALRTNIAAFTDPANLDNIGRFVATGRFPWETSI
ncbi:enoyl-CoA hydratase/isomerase [Janthinobacterium sp. FT14W]|uniref:enoyl-CoA hydratase/isomerase n=1 Tax=Janthinobacterium sp. FT14W TaxID=2654253 RepID=UPI001263EBE2|nr:enoyl-CoA hydratase/isomerase [Janthinobacterium sp. FT14W]KAB8061478.1 enoyl-CoA hydratase/isomerase [Janthinobacterium sp. FT14W]